MNWIKGSALQEYTLKSRRRGGGKDGHLSLIQIGNHLRAPGILSHVSGLRNTLAPSVRYYDPERNFFPRLFRNHTIAQSQQLARLCVSELTIWISQALPWQEWQCLHSPRPGLRISSPLFLPLLLFATVTHSLLLFITSPAAAEFSLLIL